MANRRIELTIKTDYVPSWGLVEGIREILQNARDAEIEYGAKMSIRHSGDTLTFTNTGCRLPLEALLLGHTTKADNESLAGQFGEGMKLGALALVRAGHAVMIRSGGEVWTTAIEDSRTFPCKVLAFHIKDGNKDKERVSVEIRGISAEVWRTVSKRFLFIQEDIGPTFQYGANQVLLDPVYRGMVYVKGIFVCEMPKLTYGYDMQHVKTDRDRKMVNPYELANLTRNLWESVIYLIDPKQRKQALDCFYDLLKEGAEDVRSYEDPYYSKYMNPDLLKEFLTCWVNDFGALTVPSESASEAMEVEHYGKRGRIVGRAAYHVLWAALGGKDELKKQFENSVTRTYRIDELTPAEATAFRLALSLVNNVQAVEPERVSVVDFKSRELRGLFAGGNILLAKWLFSRPALGLQVLIHEVAHHYGLDGSKDHVHAIESLWCSVAEQLMRAGADHD